MEAFLIALGAYDEDRHYQQGSHHHHEQCGANTTNLAKDITLVAHLYECPLGWSTNRMIEKVNAFAFLVSHGDIVFIILIVFLNFIDITEERSTIAH